MTGSNPPERASSRRSPSSNSDVSRLVERINVDLPRESWTAWPGGWPGEIEAAVLDAVFSIQAAYGSPTTGVRGVIGRWRTHRGVDTLDDLTELAAFHDHADDLLAIVDNNQTTARRPKAHVVADVAHRLTTNPGGIQLRHAYDMPPATSTDELLALDKVWRGTVGVGPVTWAYFTMLLGRPDVKADVMIRRFIATTLERDVTAAEGRELIRAAADKLSANTTDLDHAVWSYQRNL